MCHKYAFLFVILVTFSLSALAQTVDGDMGHYYEHRMTQEQDAVPVPYVRENDVVWEHIIWRTIDFREKFNHFFYFPLERNGVEGRRNFAYMLWDAVASGEVPIYEDSDMKIPLDNEVFVFRITRPDTITLEIVDEDENYEYKLVVVPKEFNSEEVLQVRVKEAWYIDKQTTEQYVRPLALCLTKERFREHGGDIDYLGTMEMFWVPMLSIPVRSLFVHNEAFMGENLAKQPTWEYIFTTRMFNSYVTRESNVYNRSIVDYLTGVDALMEAERIEAKLLNISLDMWEY